MRHLTIGLLVLVAVCFATLAIAGVVRPDALFFVGLAGLLVVLLLVWQVCFPATGTRSSTGDSQP